MVTTNEGKNKIVQDGFTRDQRMQDAETSEDAKPGKLAEYGGSNDVQKHSTGGGYSQTLFYDINPLDEGQDFSTATTSGDTATLYKAKRGDRIRARMEKENNSDGTFLESAGNGNLQAHSAQSIDYSQTTGTTTIVERKIVGVIPPDEGFDNSSGTQGAEVKIRIA